MLGMKVGKEEDGTGINNETLEEKDVKNSPYPNWSGCHVYLHVSAQQWSKLRTVTIRRPHIRCCTFSSTYPDLCKPLARMRTNPTLASDLHFWLLCQGVSPSVSR